MKSVQHNSNNIFRLLFIAYYYDQEKAVPTNRTRGILKYLPEYGWDVVVLTDTRITPPPKKDGVCYAFEQVPLLCRFISHIKTIISARREWNSDKIAQLHNSTTKSRSIFQRAGRSLYYLARLLLVFPDQHKLWKRSGIHTGITEVAAQNYDAILSTLNPITAHNIAKKLKQKTNLPWVADYRDLWAERHYENLPDWYSKIALRYEKKVLSTADHLTVVSEPWAKRLREIHRKPVTYISNGFDPELVNNGTPTDKKFTITYTGSLYTQQKYNPVPLFQAIAELLSENLIDEMDISINFYGALPGWLIKAVSDYQLESCVSLYDYVPKEEIRKIQYSSQILLLLTWDEKIGDGQYTGKVYEYLAAKRPILAIGARKQNVVNNLLSETKAGVFLSEVEEIKKQLLTWYLEYLKSGEVGYIGIEEEINKYSYRSIAKELSEILNMTVAG